MQMLASLTYAELPMLREWVIFEKIRRKQNMHLNFAAYCTYEQCSNLITKISFTNKAFERQVSMYWGNSHLIARTHRGHRCNKKTSQRRGGLLSFGFWGRAAWFIFRDISEEYASSIFRVDQCREMVKTW